jgi:predicted nucleic acid-binding protein
VSVQSLGELFAVLVRKARKPRAGAAAAMLSWGDAFDRKASLGAA